jgi:Ca2+/Na+ antiporter
MVMRDWQLYALTTAPFVIGVPVLAGILAARHRRKHPPTPVSIESAKTLSDPRWLRSGWVAMVFNLVYLGAYTVMRRLEPLSFGRVALVVVCCLAFVWLITEIVREVRSRDELTRRVQAEAASTALLIFLFGSMGLWVMDALDGSSHHGFFSPALAFLPINYFFAIFMTKGKYVVIPEAQE